MKSGPILIIDKVGLIGEPLFLKFSKEFPVVFVSKKSSASVSFSGKFPVIPDNKYSHIIFIDEELENLELLPKIIREAQDVNSDFIFAQGLSMGGKYAVNKVLRLCPSAKVALFGDIFDNSKFIHQAQRFGKIQILGEGLREAYPVFLNDAVDGLIDLVFGMNDKHSLFYLFPKHPITELSLAHMIQKSNPEVMVDFIKHDSRLGSISYPSNGKNLLGDKYPLAKKIRAIDIGRNTPAGGKAQEEVLYGNKKRLKGFPSFIVWVLIFLLLSPAIFTVFFSFLGTNTLYYAKGEIDKGNFINAKSSLHLSQTFFYAGKQALNILSLQAKIVSAENNLKKQSQDLDLGYKISQGLLQVFNSEIYFSKILNGKSENPRDDFAKGENYLKSSIVSLNKIKAEEKISKPILQNLEIINPLIKLLSATSDIMPSIFGMETPKTYLILFQNNMILRPSGGLIDSYGILKLNMGRITEFSIHDTDDADGQLRGHVEPPYGIRRYLPSEHWYMKDSNFDVDFVKSALSSSNFLFVETGQKVAGVIGVDVAFIKSILHAIGPVYLADYKEIVDENNLYILTQSHAERNFLRYLYKTIITKVMDAKVNYLLIAQAISDSITQKHLIFAFNNDFQNIFTVNGWSSSLWDERKKVESSVNDFVGINEANLGVNKVNYFIKRQVSQKVTIESDGNISEELTVSYKNESATWSGRDYKNYLRIILPQNTKLSDILIQDIPQNIVDAVTDPLVYEAKNFKAPVGLEVEKVQEESKTIYGFLVNIPVGELVKIKLKYTLPISISGLNTFSYNLKLFKQPGVNNIPYSFSLLYPSNFNLTDTSEGLIQGEDRVSYSKKIVQDQDLTINFAKK